jgi:hypothetical protein
MMAGMPAKITGINISFLDVTEEGGHSLSPEKFAKQRRF